MIKIQIVLLSLIISISLFTRQASAATDVLFILDASGSMREKIAGESKIDSARHALKEALREIPNTSQVALRLYGHRVDQKDKAASCRDTELAVPFDTAAKDKIAATVDSLTPLGYTPISYTLQTAKDDFNIAREADKVIVLLSDGEETCGGDPKATITKLINDGFKVKVYSIGFDVNNIAERQLRDIAEVSGGKYFGPKSASELRDAFSSITHEAIVINKDKSDYGVTIRGGDNFETAVPLQFNTEYKLDHNQKSDDFDYFTFEANTGDEITLVVRTLDLGTEINNKGISQQTTNLRVDASLLDSNRGKIFSIVASGQFRREDRLLQVDNSGKYFVLIGGHSPLPLNGGLFEIQRITRGDAGTEKDAGSKYDSALLITPGRYDSNYFAPGSNDIDVYSFQATQGERYRTIVIPQAGQKYSINLTINSDLGDKLVDTSAADGNPAKTNTFTIPETGLYYISIRACCFSTKVQEYSLILKQEQATEKAE